MLLALPALALLAAAGCTKEYSCPVPSVDRFYFDLVIPSNGAITAKAVSGYGYKKHGVIVYYHYGEEVYAFDATCPDSEACMESGLVVVNSDNMVMATCRKCGSQYYLRDGKHQQKHLMLRPYNVQRIANTAEQYRVSNF